jgi:hypothetical protein
MQTSLQNKIAKLQMLAILLHIYIFYPLSVLYGVDFYITNFVFRFVKYAADLYKLIFNYSHFIYGEQILSDFQECWNDGIDCKQFHVIIIPLYMLLLL